MIISSSMTFIISMGIILSLPCYGFEENKSKIEIVEVKFQQKNISEQKLSSSIVTIDNDTLTKSGLTQTSDLQLITAGLSSGDFNLAQPQYYIRGIGSNADSASSESSISYYLNGLYIGRTASQNIPLFDLQQVEIIKGPQGTYLGKNSLAGSISIRSASAEFDNFANISVTALSRQGIKTKALFNHSKHSWATRFAFYHFQQDGHVKNKLSGESFSNIKSTAARWSSRYISSKNNEHKLIVSYNSDKPTSNGVRTIDGLIGQSNEILYPKQNNDWYHSFEKITSALSREITNITYLFKGKAAGLNADIVIGNNCFDYQHFDNPLPSASLQTAPNIYNNVLEGGCQTGFNLALQPNQSSIIFGLYADQEKTNKTETGIIEYLQSSITGGTRQKSSSKHLSLFAANEVHLGKLLINFGARVGEDNKDISIATTTVDGQFVRQPYNIQKSYQERFFTPHLHIKYFDNDKNLTYLSFDTGYKAGGFSPGATAAESKLPFEKEQALSAELGYKWQNKNNDIQFNSSLFYGQFRDLQVLVQREVAGQQISITRTENAAKAYSRGLESTIKTYWQNVHLFASIALLDARYNEYTDNSNIHGNRLRNAPKLSSSLRIDYFPSDYWQWQWMVSLTTSYQSLRYQDPQNYQPAAIPSYVLTHLTLLAESGAHKVNVGVKNLFNKRYLMHSFSSPTGRGTLGTFPSVAEPRVFFIEYQHSW